MNVSESAQCSEANFLVFQSTDVSFLSFGFSYDLLLVLSGGLKTHRTEER